LDTSNKSKYLNGSEFCFSMQNCAKKTYRSNS
jgi:hypothetical protein